MPRGIADPELRWQSSYVEDPSGCWLWIKSKNSTGYGAFWLDGKYQTAHRVSYERHKGPIPEGLDLDHLCRVRACINPDHLEPVTRQENVARGLLAEANRSRQWPKRTHCKMDHELTDDNRTKSGVCRVCSLAYHRKRKAELRRASGVPLRTERNRDGNGRYTTEAA